MSKFLHDDNAKAIAIHRVFSENSQSKSENKSSVRRKKESRRVYDSCFRKGNDRNQELDVRLF